MRETSLWWLAPPIAIVIIGTIVILATSGIRLGEPEVSCTTEIIALAPPSTPDLIIDAMQKLIDEGLIPSREAALESFAGAQFIFDPDEDNELEYWVLFRNATALMAAEFNFSCPLDTENYPLDLEYEGVRAIG